jgi:hypothetical protein
MAERRVERSRQKPRPHKAAAQQVDAPTLFDLVEDETKAG